MAHNLALLDWRTLPLNYPLLMPYHAGQPAPVWPSPFVFLLRCSQCDQGWLAGSPAELVPCPNCEGTLMIERLWDLRKEAYPWATPMLAKLYRHFN